MSAMNNQSVGSEGKPIYLDQHGAAKATTPATSSSSVDTTNLNDNKLVTKGYVDKNMITVTPTASYSAGTKLGNITVKDGANVEKANKDIFVPNATASQKGAIKTAISADAVGTDASGDLKAITVSKGGGSYAGDDDKLASKGYVDSKKTVVTVTPSATSGTLVGKISVDGAEKSLYAPTYSLPTAAAGTKGGVKVGDTLEMGGTNSEVLNVKTASTTQKGVVQIGSRLSVSNGVVSADAQTPTAGSLISVTDTRKVSIKIDPSLVNADGTVKNVDFLGVSNDKLVATNPPAYEFLYPDFSTRRFTSKLLISANDDTYIDADGWTDGAVVAIDGSGGKTGPNVHGQFEIVKNSGTDGDQLAYFDYKMTRNSFVVVGVERIINKLTAGLLFRFRQNDESELHEMFSWHPVDGLASTPNTSMAWDKTFVFQSYFKVGSTLRIGLVERTSSDVMQRPIGVYVYDFGLY